MATIVESNPAPFNAVTVDRITLDLIENGLINARQQMDSLLFRTAMSPIIREQRDGFPVITNRHGRLLAGQFGSPVSGFIDQFDTTTEEGDVFLTSDPYACRGSISHANDWLVCIPVFHQGRLINWSAMFGHMSDIGGKVPGSMPTDAREMYEEGIYIPPIKIFKRGELQEDVLKVILRNCRIPEWNRSDFNALVAAARIGEARCQELAERFGVDLFTSALDELLARNRRAIAKIIRDTMSTEKIYFEDYICDDGIGMGPYKIACHMWREGERLIFDFGATDPQSQSNINFLLSEQMYKMFCAQFMIMMFDPDVLLNDGFFELMEVRIPEGSLLAPRPPAALNGRTHAMGRIFDVISALYGKSNPTYLCAAGFSASPHFMYSGYDENKRRFLLFQIGFGGVPARPLGDGLDGHSLWPKFTNVPNEYLESYFPIRIDAYETIPDSGGAGRYRGGNGMRIGYRFLAPGKISIHDDRWLTYPWGVKGGEPGVRSHKLLRRVSGGEEVLPAKIDNVIVAPGDLLIFDTWGGGGLGLPYERELAAVEYDLDSGFLTADGALRYGVILNSDRQSIDRDATEELRTSLRARTTAVPLFNFGGTPAELVARCREETGLSPPVPPVFLAH
ncbi:MAG: hydantoinase B/oxoprolinase family protein [Gammaproteobacteria bacterium]|nr:hydantoinase B/oxoprolinase family protein [Gammaproteobacteria bacterium]